MMSNPAITQMMQAAGLGQSGGATMQAPPQGQAAPSAGTGSPVLDAMVSGFQSQNGSNIPQGAPTNAPSSPAPPTMPPQGAAQMLPTFKSLGPVAGTFDNLFLGGSIEHARANAYAAQLQNYQMQRLAALYPTLPATARAAISLGAGADLGKAYAQTYANQSVRGGDSVQYGGPDGPMVTAPLVGVDPASGRPYSITPSSSTTYPAVGPDYTSSDGVTYDKRSGTVGFVKPQLVDRQGGHTYNFESPPLVGGAPSGSGVGGDQGSGTSPPNSAGAPSRGQRNMNLLNVKALPNGQQWNGQTGTDPDGFAQFPDAQTGLAAGVQNLHNQQRLHGLNTVSSIINRLAPASDGNNPDVYAAYVASYMGVKPTDKINLDDPDTLQRMTTGMVHYENGAGRGSRSANRSGSISSGYSGPMTSGPAVGPLAANDPAYQGAPPGTLLQRKPDGTIGAYVDRSTQALPTPDQDRLNGIKEQALKMSRLAQLGQQFTALQAKHKTGGLNALPGVADVMSAVDPTTSEMSSLTKAMIPLQRDVGAGPIRVGEIQGPGGGIWGGDVPRLQAPAEANIYSQKNWGQIAKQLNDYATFADQWSQTHATLAGMDQAWAKQNGGAVMNLPSPTGAQPAGAARSGPVTLDAKDPNATFRSLPKGAQYIGPDGKLRVK